MNDFVALAPLLGGLGSFAFACVMCFAMMQHMRAQSEKMLEMMGSTIKEGTAATFALVTAIEKLDTRIDAMRRN